MIYRTELLAAWLNDALDSEYGLLGTLRECLEHGGQEDSGRAAELVSFIRGCEMHIEAIGDLIVRLGGLPGRSAQILEPSVQLVRILEVVPKYTEVRRFIHSFIYVQGLIARYGVALTAARELEEGDAAMVIEGVLIEDREVARWLEEYLPDIVKTVLRVPAVQGGMA